MAAYSFETQQRSADYADYTDSRARKELDKEVEPLLLIGLQSA
jgi:hypothetical protein